MTRVQRGDDAAGRRRPRAPGDRRCRVEHHWPIGDGIVIDWLSQHLPDPRHHRIYFDHGTATLDAAYAPYQARMDAAVRAAGYTPGRHWVTRRFEGAEHNERAWRARIDEPLLVLPGR